MSSLPAISMVNGRVGAEIPVSDRGLQYGDGLFETIRVAAGQCQFWDLHIERLARGCQVLGIDCPAADLLLDESRHLLASGDHRDAVLKLTVTRGSGGRGYLPPSPQSPNRVFSIHPQPLYPDYWYDRGVTAKLCKTRLARQPVLAGLKHLNRLEQVLARREWRDEFAEGIMLDDRGRVIEGVMSNVFALIDSMLVTPALDQCGVAGVVRERVLRRQEQVGDPVAVRQLSLDELLDAEAVFLTNSVIGVWQLHRLESKTWAPHALAARLRALSGWDNKCSKP